MNQRLIFLEGKSFLIWKADDVKFFRETAKIFGNLTMTSPWYNKQNLNLSLPFEITQFEAKWCLENGYCKLVRPIFKKNIQSFQELPSFKSDIQQLFDEKEFEIEEITDYHFNVDDFQYSVYCFFKEKGFYVTEGLQYGCDFAIYKNSPWACHSSLLVWCEKTLFDTRKLIQHVRIADSARKKAVAAIETFDKKLNFVEFSRIKVNDDKEIT